MLCTQVRLCLDKQDFVRAQILSRKISPRAFVEKKGDSKGEIGIEGTAIEAPDEVCMWACCPDGQLTDHCQATACQQLWV
jgi:hypothetical protein